MKALILDTSHDVSYIVLMEDNEIIVLKKIEKMMLSKTLLLDLDTILKENSLEISALSYIAASIGPGSYTGLRVGASVCKTLSYAKKVPLIGYSSLKAYSADVEGKFLSVFDAKSEGVFAIEAIQTQKSIKYLSEPKLINNENANELFEKVPLIVSPDAEILKDKFPEHQNKFIKRHLNPQIIFDITNELFESKKHDNFESFKLLYLRGPNQY